MWVFLFMIKVVNEITPVLNRKETKKHGPIRIEKQSEETKTAKESVIKVYKPMQSCVESKHSIETPINSEMANIKRNYYHFKSKIYTKDTEYSLCRLVFIQNDNIRIRNVHFLNFSKYGLLISSNFSI